MRMQSVFAERPDGYGEINKITVAVSGGRTSAYMAYFLLKNKAVVSEYIGIPEDEIEYLFVFANTGMEHGDTYRFLSDVNKHILGGALVMVEPKISPRLGEGTTHRTVSAETTMRMNDFKGSAHPFSSFIKKYGIPNNQAPQCTRAMKLESVDSYVKEAGFKKSYRAIGIRDDERRRVSKNSTKDKIIYPLVDIFPADKEDVLDFFSQYDWDLKIPEHLGNCVTCFKKGGKKLYMAYKECPEYFDFNIEMEALYGRAGARFDSKRAKNFDADAPDNVFFRGGRSTKDMIKLFEVFDESGRGLDDRVDEGGCSESCEIYQTELF